jgi:hypothetical protein
VSLAVYGACRVRGAHRKRAAVIAIAAATASLPGMTLRPQLFALVLFALVQLILLERDRRPMLLALLPPLFVVWANVHGTFPLGILLTVLALIEQLERRGRIRELAIVLGASVLATGVTPWGYGVWRYSSTSRRTRGSPRGSRSGNRPRSDPNPAWDPVRFAHP